jgi:hypothetical protein
MNKVIVLAACTGALLAPLAWAQSAPPPPAIGANPAAAAIEAAPAGAAAQPASAPPAAAADRQGRIGGLLETHIEQVRRGNRVTEVRVTGADGAPRYSIENRDLRAPSPLESQRSGLSTPNFLNIEF